MNKRWIVTAVDHGETCDGKARVLKVCNTKEEAEAYVHADIESWANERDGEDIEVDFDKMSAHYEYNHDNGCEWNIEEVEIPAPSAECINKEEQDLADDSIDENEADDGRTRQMNRYLIKYRDTRAGNRTEVMTTYVIAPDEDSAIDSVELCDEVLECRVVEYDVDC